jgi:hypothetical protein
MLFTSWTDITVTGTPQAGPYLTQHLLCITATDHPPDLRSLKVTFRPVHPNILPTSKPTAAMPFNIVRALGFFHASSTQYHLSSATASTDSELMYSHSYGIDSPSRNGNHRRSRGAPRQSRHPGARSSRPGMSHRTPNSRAVNLDTSSDLNTWRNRRRRLSADKYADTGLPKARAHDRNRGDQDLFVKQSERAARHPQTPRPLEYMPGKASSQIPHPSTSPQGYPRRQTVDSPLRMPYLGPSLPPPGTRLHRSKSEEDFQSLQETEHVARNRKEALDMLEGRIPAQPFSMRGYAAMHKDFEAAGPDGSVACYVFKQHRDRVQFRLAERELADRKKRKPEDRSDEMKAKIGELKKLMEQRKKVAHDPTENTPWSPQPPRSTKTQGAEAAGPRQLPAWADYRIANPTKAPGKAEEKKIPRKKLVKRIDEPTPPPPTSKPQHRQPARPLSYRSQAGPYPYGPAPTKTAAQQEEQDVARAIAASLADMERQKPMTWAQRRVQEQQTTESTFWHPHPVMPSVLQRTAEQPRYMEPTQTWAQRGAQLEPPVCPRVGPNSQPSVLGYQVPSGAPDEPSWPTPQGVPRRGWNNGARAPPPVRRTSGRRGNPKDPTTGESLTDEAWNAQIC